MIPLLLVAPALAAELSLAQVREVATRDALAVERAQTLAAQEQAEAWSVTAANLPAITGFASWNIGAGLTSFGFPRPVSQQSGVGIRGQWVLISPAQWAAAAAARRQVAGQDALARWAVVSARRDATAAVAGLLAAELELAALEQAQDDARSAAEAVQALVQAGIVPPADSAQARAEAAALFARTEEARWQAHQRCAEVLTLTRQDIPDTCVLETPDWGQPKEGPPSHPALDAAQAALSATSATRVSAMGTLGPTVTATGSVAWYAADAAAGAGWSTGLEATTPLLGGGGKLADVRSATHEVELARLAVEERTRALRLALAGAEARYRSALVGLDARVASFHAAEEALTLVEERYVNGITRMTAWLDARRRRDDAAIALARARAELGVALAELEAARGVAW